MDSGGNPAWLRSPVVLASSCSSAAACLFALCPEQQGDGEKGHPSLQRRPLEQNSAWEQSTLTLCAAARINLVFHQSPKPKPRRTS